VPVLAREYRLREALAPAVGNYDYVFIDCPPSLGLLTVNALAAADAVLIPLQCEYFALEGVSELVSTLRRVQRSLNPRLDIAGVLLTMVDERMNLTQQVTGEIREHFKEKVFRTTVPRSVRLAEAPSFGKPILLYDIKSKGAEAYLDLAKEMMAHEKKGAGQGAERPPAGS
jgi:chromosome partitioning protein